MERHKPIRPGAVYDRVFIGIYLPIHLRSQYDRVLRSIRRRDPSVNTLSSDIPHSTLLSLGTQTNGSIKRVVGVVSAMAGDLKSCHLQVGGFNDSGFDVLTKKGLLSLRVEDSQFLKGFARQLGDKLSFLTGHRKDPPNPHVSLGYTSRYGLADSSKGYMMDVINGVNWEFELEEITIFGKDRREPCRKFESLATIPVTPSKDYPYRRSHPHSERFRYYQW